MNLFDNLQSHIREFWTKFSKLEFLNCTIDSLSAKRSAHDFKLIVGIYSQATFFSEELEEELSLMENLVRASMINACIMKATFIVYERICRELSSRVELRNSILIERMVKKMKVCERLLLLERKIKSNNKVSYTKIKDTVEEFSEFCDEILLNESATFLESLIKSTNELLNAAKDKCFLGELQELVRKLKELPI